MVAALASSAPAVAYVLYFRLIARLAQRGAVER